MNTDLQDLQAWFSDPDRKAAIGPRAIWLSEANILALSKNAYFMEVFRRLHPAGTISENTSSEP